ncbi:hypothetical protein Pmani_012459 [Petrolisthes manimaculis]|uniref:Reverse transcriptase domain-containing protein n=1 Tax=Petrolisthes manimaculis TaxID=1843537 RepID=A0AAE1PX06_9EUCA|nr:hypothetical protein Pmani_012459 [Petrolisthes manimaculis]
MKRLPDIIALQEVKPKNFRYKRDLAEYVLDEYKIIEQNIHNEEGRAVKNGSEVFLYADDTKIFRKIGNAEDHTKLQEDLDELRRWTEKWLLSFHPDKSRYMRLGRTTVEDQEYSLQNPIQRSDQEKDVIDDTLTFSDHLAEKINKANRIVGLVRRTFTNLEPETFKPLFTALVRPHLEYANQHCLTGLGHIMAVTYGHLMTARGHTSYGTQKLEVRWHWISC